MSAQWKEIDDLKAEWDRLQPLSPENHARLWKKLRLEWNYHSNHIEGNTLTYGETELLLLHGDAAGDHPLRDYEEMKAHDAAIAYVEELAKDKTRLLGESDIRDLNRIALKEPFWKEAITPDGQPTRKQIVPGEYKTSPNNVRTATGEIFHFASPEETPSRMQEFIAWMRGELESPTTHTVEFLARLHHDLVLIHPFDDGNGRVTRLVLNYVLLLKGYAPIIIKSEDKANYLAALRKADVGDLHSLALYLSAQIAWSLGIGIKAAKGESIEELSDIEKEVAIFVRNQKTAKQVKARSPGVLADLYKVSLATLFDKFVAKISRLYPLFSEHSVRTGYGQASHEEAFRMLCNNGSSEFSIIIDLRGYQGEASSPFNMTSKLSLEFGQFEYSVTLAGKTHKRLYSEPILSDEAEMMTVEALKALFEDIKDPDSLK